MKSNNPKSTNFQIHEFDPVIYPYSIWIVVSKNTTQISEHFYNYDGSEMNAIECKNIEAFTIPVMEKKSKQLGSVIYFPSRCKMTYKNVAHEASHAAKSLFEHIEADMREHEPFEYVVGWIADCCEKVKKGSKT